MKRFLGQARNLGAAGLLGALGVVAIMASVAGVPISQDPIAALVASAGEVDTLVKAPSDGAEPTSAADHTAETHAFTKTGAFEQALQVGWSAVVSGAKFTLMYLALVVMFHVLKIHKRFGFFRTEEPVSHFKTSLLNWKVPFMWGVGVALACWMLQIDPESVQAANTPSLMFTLPDDYIFLNSPNIWTHVLWAILGFYLIDLTDWTAHWINHQYPSLYSKFPFAHFVHHNMVFINPFTIFSSPLVHFAQLTGLCMYVLLLSQGLWQSVLMIHSVKVISNAVSHLGFDPLPWLSRLNHRVGGWIPWIPLHHQYHHIPGMYGNYGNITCLWDYVFGTVTPQCIPHLESGKALPEIAKLMANENGEIDEFMKGKTRFNLG